MPATETVTEKPDVGRLLHRLANRVDRFARGGLLAVIEAAASATAVDPSDAQREAGNYRKGRVTLHGLPITIETPKGAIRRGVNSEGDTWEVEMPHHYGYFRLTESEADGDHVDCFIGPNPKSEIAFIIDQCTPGGHFDEHKVMLGWTNAEAAKAAYLSAYSDDWEGFDGIQAMTVEQLAEWLKKGDTSKRVARYAQWNESQHPRANDGKFGEGGGDSAPNRETQKTATDLADGIEAASPGLKLDLFDKSKLYGDRKVWELARIVVPKTARGSGLGSTVMQQITAAADKAGATITLDPSTDFGASSKARLIDFYRRFGFVPNKGRGADLSLSGAMVRLPQTPRIDHARPTRGLTVREALERIDYKKHKPAAGQKSIEWDEDKHPRADDGKFGSGPGSSAPNKVTEKTAEAEPDQNNETPEQKTERIRREAAEEYKREGVRSKFFKQWFGDWEHDQQNASKVVDEDGKPKETTGIDGEGSKVMKDGKPVTVYHGTKFGGFNEFQRKKLKDPDELLFGQGFYFTEDDTVADQYAGRTEYHAANGFDTKEDAQEWINFKAKNTRDSFKSTLDDITFKVAVDKQNPSKFAVRLFGYEKASNVLNRELGDADIGKARSFLAEQGWMGTGENRKGNEEMAKAIANTAWDAAMVTKSGADGMRELNTLLRDPQTYWINKRQQMPSSVPYTATPEFLEHVDKLREAVGVQSIPPSREVKKIFLNIRKPLDMDKPISSKKPYADAARRIASDVLRVNKIAAKPGKFAPYKDAAGLRDSLNQWADSASQKVVGLPNDTETGESVYSFLTQMLGKAAAEHVIREAGHDGITHIGGHRMGGGHEHRVWIAFEPTQIKSTDNAGTFDPSQPRVDYKKHKPAPGQSTLWDESAHPRDDDGKFGSGSGGSAPVNEAKKIDPEREAKITKLADELYNHELAGYGMYGYTPEQIEGIKKELRRKSDANAANRVRVDELLPEMEKHTKEYADMLDGARRTAVNKYTSHYSRAMNEGLRNCPDTLDCVDPAYRDEAKEHVPKAISAIEHAPPLPPDTLLYHGLGLYWLEPHERAPFIAKFQPGLEFSLKGITSTTFDREVADRFSGGSGDTGIIFHIKAKRGLYVAAMGSFGDKEREVIQRPNTRYRVTGVGYDDITKKKFIEVDEV